MRRAVKCTRFITLAHVFLELFPFDYFPYNFVSALYLKKTVRDIFSMKPDTLIKQNDGICDAEELKLLLAYFGHALRKGGDISFHIENKF